MKMMNMPSIKKYNIESRPDYMKLRLSGDSQYAAVLDKSGTGYIERRESITVHSLTDQTWKGRKAFVPKSLGKIDYVADVFDISHDGRYIAITFNEGNVPSSCDGMYCRIYDIKNKGYLPDFIKQNLLYKSGVGFGIDGQRGFDWIEVRFLDEFRLATVTISGEVFIWDYLKQQLIMSWTGVSHFAGGVAFPSKFGTYAMAEANRQFVRVGHIGRYEYQYGNINLPTVGWTPLQEGDFLRLWDIHSGTVVRDFECEYPIHELMFSPDDRLLVGYTDQEDSNLLMWDVLTGKLLMTLPDSGMPIGFTSDGLFLVIQKDNVVKLWSVLSQSWGDFEFTSDGIITDCRISKSNVIVAVYKTIDNWGICQIDLNT
jgi:WD40 repeat protein